MPAEPFCGNAASAVDPVDAGPAIGECGKCKLKSDGTGGFSDCSSSDPTAFACSFTDTTCIGEKVCCSDGSCQANASDCP